MVKRRLMYIGTIVGLVLALAVSFQPVSARSVHSLTLLQPTISVTVRISQPRVIRRPRLGERITAVIILRGLGLRPRARLVVKDVVIVRVNGRSRAAVINAGGSLEAEENMNMTAETDDSGTLSEEIPVDMTGPEETPGTVNGIADAVTVSDSSGRQLASNNATASVTSN